MWFFRKLRLLCKIIDKQELIYERHPLETGAEANQSDQESLEGVPVIPKDRWSVKVYH